MIQSNRHRGLRALVGASAVVCAMAVLILTGCSETDEPSAKDVAAANSSAPGGDTLTKAVRGLEGQTMSLNVTTDKLLFDGTYDAKARTGTMNVEFAGAQVSAIVIGKDLYLKGLPNRPADKWLHFDSGKLPATNPFAAVVDPLAGTAYLIVAANAVASGEGDYTGTIDLRKYVSVEADLGRRARAANLVSSLGDPAGQLQFTATLDDQERLTEMSIGTKPTNDEATPDFVAFGQFSEFGTKVDAVRPATNDVAEAPADAYNLTA